ncbi:porin [Variovorax sp. J22G21]|uniref:porin n=1 Tax=Variovorax fucosicus TaxID=3053517 RepID=UPI002574990A|nr:MULTISPECIES: porin [unclassified Variovorax]MDM0042685.1 porin [Variovorax sp. J22R193]MDM0064737.1 porin [Variovorax sp. J22G21]
MKRTLAAMAALLAAGFASAQSSVTLFGVVDTAISYQSATSRDALTGQSYKQSQWALTNSGYNSSRLGFRGTEDLGGGLAASFWLEAPISSDDGGTGLNFSRRSTVSLSGGFGEVRLGRDYTATFWNDTVFDPFGTNGSGTSVISSVSGSSNLANPKYVRSSNTVGYFLPPNLGGFYGQVQYGLHENVDTSTSSTTTASTNSNAGRYVGGRFGYANGPLDIAASYGESTIVDTSALTRKIQTANLGASYDFGPVKLFSELSQVRNKFEGASLASYNDNYNGYLLGATVPVGAGLIRAAYSAVRYDEGATGLYGERPRVQKLAIGYVHNLSKRTALYTTVARVNNRNDALYTGALSSAITTGGSVGYTGIPRSSTGYDFGIRHAF